MPANKEEKEIDSVDDHDVEYDEFDDSDYGFIIGPDGELKSVMFPEDLMFDPPKEIKKILKIFGIKDINDLSAKTIH
jgi:hypothetical protein